MKINLLFFCIITFALLSSCKPPENSSVSKEKKSSTVIHPMPDTSGLWLLIQARRSSLREIFSNWSDSLIRDSSDCCESWNHPLDYDVQNCDVPGILYLNLVYIVEPEVDRYNIVETQKYCSGRIMEGLSADQIRYKQRESLVVSFDFLNEKYLCRISTCNKENEPIYSDFISSEEISIEQADSALAKWGIKRIAPVEKWLEDYKARKGK